MPLHGHSTCAHCGALLSGPICAICGKSVHDVVEVIEAPRARPGLSAQTTRQLRSLGLVLLSMIGLGAGLAWALTGSESEPVPTALGVPDTTTTTEPSPTSIAPVDRPGTDAQPLPPIAATELAERTVEDAVNPWNGAPPRNVLTGDLLDNTDYQPGIDAVASRLAQRTVGFVLGPLTNPQWNGVDLEAAESSQPFAARGVADESGPITDVWIIARGPATDDGSAAFLATARALWPVAAPLDSFSPRAGIRIHQISVAGPDAVWVDDRGDWLLLYRTTVDVDPALLGAISETWP